MSANSSFWGSRGVGQPASGKRIITQVETEADELRQLLERRTGRALAKQAAAQKETNGITPISQLLQDARDKPRNPSAERSSAGRVPWRPEQGSAERLAVLSNEVAHLRSVNQPAPAPLQRSASPPKYEAPSMMECMGMHGGPPGPHPMAMEHAARLAGPGFEEMAPVGPYHPALHPGSSPMRSHMQQQQWPQQDMRGSSPQQQQWPQPDMRGSSPPRHRQQESPLWHSYLPQREGEGLEREDAYAAHPHSEGYHDNRQPNHQPHQGYHTETHPDTLRMYQNSTQPSFEQHPSHPPAQQVHFQQHRHQPQDLPPNHPAMQQQFPCAHPSYAPELHNHQTAAHMASSVVNTFPPTHPLGKPPRSALPSALPSSLFRTDVADLELTPSETKLPRQEMIHKMRQNVCRPPVLYTCPLQQLVFLLLSCCCR